MTVMNLLRFDGLKCCHRAVRMCCQILLAIGLLAGLSLLAAAATLHGNTEPDVRLVALVYIGGLVVCVCGGLLVVFCASAAADSAIPDAALIAQGDFWSDSCTDKQCYESFLGALGPKKSYFTDQHVWHTKESCCQLAELPGESKCFSDLSADNRGYCVHKNKCHDEKMCIGMETWCKSPMLESERASANMCKCKNFTVENGQQNFKKYHTLTNEKRSGEEVFKGPDFFNALSAEEAGVRNILSGKEKSGIPEKICSSSSHCISHSKSCSNCACSKHNGEISCSLDERRKLRYCAHQDYNINSLCHVHGQHQTPRPCNDEVDSNKEVFKKSRCVNFSQGAGCQRCVRKVEFCDACVHETGKFRVQPVAPPRDGRSPEGPDRSTGCGVPAALTTSMSWLERNS